MKWILAFVVPLAAMFVGCGFRLFTKREAARLDDLCAAVDMIGAAITSLLIYDVAKAPELPAACSDACRSAIQLVRTPSNSISLAILLILLPASFIPNVQ